MILAGSNLLKSKCDRQLFTYWLSIRQLEAYVLLGSSSSSLLVDRVIRPC